MENSPQVFAGVPWAYARANAVNGPGESQDVSRSIQQDLLLMARLRTNLLVVGVSSVIAGVVERLLPALEDPIATWRPGERLVLPPVPEAGTMILHDVGALALEDQRRLFEWSELAAGHMRLVSITDEPLFPRVQAGTFSERLYYRLNTLCVDVTA